MSQAEGGQRCYGHAAQALEAAETRFDKVDATRRRTMQAGDPVPAALNVQHLAASFNLDDARARYASTPQGLEQLSKDLQKHVRAGMRPCEADAIGEAITIGRRLRQRATEIKASVTGGHLTEEEARALAQHPTYEIMALREEMLHPTPPRVVPYIEYEPRPLHHTGMDDPNLRAQRQAQATVDAERQPHQAFQSSYQNRFTDRPSLTAPEDNPIPSWPGTRTEQELDHMLSQVNLPWGAPEDLTRLKPNWGANDVDTTVSWTKRKWF